MRFELLELVNKKLPDFEDNVSENLFRAEKILKAEVKLSNDFTLQDVENFMHFFISKGEKYKHTIRYEVVLAILRRDVSYFLTKSNQEHLEELEAILKTKPDFSVDFEEVIWDFFNKLLLENKWNLLANLLIKTPMLLSVVNTNRLIEVLTEKLIVLVEVVSKTNEVAEIATNYPHSIHPLFFVCLSSLNPLIFEEEIITLYNFFVVKEKSKNKSDIEFCYKMLFSITHFENSNDHNTSLFLKTRRKMLNKIYFIDKEYYNLFKSEEMIASDIQTSRNISLILSGAYFLILYFLYNFLYSKLIYVWFLTIVIGVGVSTLISYFAFKEDDESYQFNFKKGIFTLKNLQAFCWLTFKGQLLGVILAVFISLLFLVVSVGIAILVYGGIGILGLFILFRIIKAIFK